MSPPLFASFDGVRFVPRYFMALFFLFTTSIPVVWTSPSPLPTGSFEPSRFWNACFGVTGCADLQTKSPPQAFVYIETTPDDTTEVPHPTSMSLKYTNLQLKEWFTLHPMSHDDPFSMYRSCVRDRDALATSFGIPITACWRYADEQYSHRPAPMDPHIAKIQTLYDLVANRFTDVPFVDSIFMVRFLMGEAMSWSPHERRSVLFHTMRYGLRTNQDRYDLPLMAWKAMCPDTRTLPNAPPVPVDGCLQAASILAESSGLNHQQVISLLKININQAKDLQRQGEKYLELLKHCESMLNALLDKNMGKFRNFLQVCEELNTSVWEGLPPLLAAAGLGNSHAVWFLLKRAADVNLGQAWRGAGTTALTLATDANHEAMVRSLLEGGAAPNYAPGEHSALSLAAKHSLLGIARVLLEYGADPNAADGSHDTPFMYAVVAGRLDMVRLLLNNQADIKASNTRDGSTVLMKACGAGQLRMVQFLLERGANPNAQDHQSRTALTWAIKRRHADVVELLLSYPITIPNRLEAFAAARTSGDVKLIHMTRPSEKPTLSWNDSF